MLLPCAYSHISVGLESKLMGPGHACSQQVCVFWHKGTTSLQLHTSMRACPPAALYPIDTIKTRLQAMIGGGGIKALLQSGGGKGLYAGEQPKLHTRLPGHSRAWGPVGATFTS